MASRMKNLIEVAVDSIRIHMPTAQHLVILKEKEADRYLPIWIGSFEAQAIAAKISGNSVGRPLTHDLMAAAFGDLGVSIKRIVVTRLADQVFYARLYVKQDGRDLDFDARPSDAIALAVRAECPIFVATEVMDTAGIIPEAEDRKSTRLNSSHVSISYAVFCLKKKKKKKKNKQKTKNK